MRKLGFVVCALATLVLAPPFTDPASAQTEKRVALVIGNSAYKNASELKNPSNDASDMAAALKSVGFRVIEGRDLDKGAMDRIVRDFSEALVGADVGLFFYAGHGLQVAGNNYLVPIDAKLSSSAGLDFEMIRLDLVQRQMERETKTNVLILDACRDNPLARNLARAMGTRSADVGKGLANAESGVGTLVSFATQPGNVALDGEGRNSPFTAALVKNIATPGRDLNGILIAVRNDVRSATAGRQVPWENSALTGQFYFRAPAAAAPPPESSLANEAALAWSATKDTTNVGLLEAFIARYGDTFARYGDTFHANLARARLDELKKSQVAIVAPPVTPAAPPSPVTPAVGVFPPTSGATALSLERERALKPKDSFKECDACPEMVVAPAGSFTMGSPESEKERLPNEGPQHRVTFAKAFAVGKFAVTFDEWNACVTGGGCNGYKPSDSNWGRGRRPVINVNWDDAKAYVAWLSKKTGKGYRLLSEAEREYVTRAGTATPFWWGSTISTSQANYDGNYTHGGQKGEYRKKTVPVDSFAPNPWGLYQVHGNVWDWVEDCYHDSYAGAPSDGSAWTSGGDCTRRVLRGGPYFLYPEYLRAAKRLGFNSDHRQDVFGFRVARTLVPLKPPGSS